MKLSKPGEIEAEPDEYIENGEVMVNHPFLDEMVTVGVAIEQLSDQLYSEVDNHSDKINELESRIEKLEGEV